MWQAVTFYDDPLEPELTQVTDRRISGVSNLARETAKTLIFRLDASLHNSATQLVFRNMLNAYNTNILCDVPTTENTTLSRFIYQDTSLQVFCEPR